MAEDYLKQVTVGEVEAHGGPIRLCPYDRRWPEQFPAIRPPTCCYG